MNFVADEGVDAPIVDRLRHDGLAVFSVRESLPESDDEAVLREANGRDALLITADKDFGELVFRMGQVHAGVVLLRLEGLSMAVKCDAVSTAIRDHAADLENSFSVISPGKLRIRKKL